MAPSEFAANMSEEFITAPIGTQKWACSVSIEPSQCRSFQFAHAGLSTLFGYDDHHKRFASIAPL
jgi:hypothetical protein